MVVLSQIDSWKFVQQKLQKLTQIAKMPRSQQVNETVEGLIIVLKMNKYPFSGAPFDQYIDLHNSEFIRWSHFCSFLSRKQLLENGDISIVGIFKIRSSGQFKIWLEQFSTAVTVKENVHTELRSADPNKCWKTHHRDRTSQGTAKMLGKNRPLRDNVERVDVLQDNEKKLEAKKWTQPLLKRGAENIRALTTLDILGCGGIEREFKDIAIMAKSFFQKAWLTEG